MCLLHAKHRERETEERQRQTSSDTELLQNCRSCLCMLMMKMDFINNICRVVVMQACSMHFSPSSDRWCNKTKGSSKQAKKQKALESTPAGLIPPGMQFGASLFCCGEWDHNACCWFPCHFRTWSQSQRTKLLLINQGCWEESITTDWEKQQEPQTQWHQEIMYETRNKSLYHIPQMSSWWITRQTNKQTCMHELRRSFAWIVQGMELQPSVLDMSWKNAKLPSSKWQQTWGMFELKSRKASILQTWGTFGLKSRKALILQTWVCLDWSQGKFFHKHGCVWIEVKEAWKSDRNSIFLPDDHHF